MKKFRDGWAEGTHAYHATVRLIWKQKIWLSICEFLFRDFPVNQFNFKFLHSISTFCTNFVFLHSKNFKFLHCLGLIDVLSANQHGEISLPTQHESFSSSRLIECVSLVASIHPLSFEGCLFFFSQKIGDYLLTLPQQLEPFITQDNPGLAAAMKAGNLPFPDIQGIVVASSPAVRLAKLALPTKGCSQANLCIVITGLCRIPFSIVLHLRVADVQIVCVCGGMLILVSIFWLRNFKGTVFLRNF